MIIERNLQKERLYARVRDVAREIGYSSDETEIPGQPKLQLDKYNPGGATRIYKLVLVDTGIKKDFIGRTRYTAEGMEAQLEGLITGIQLCRK